MKLLKPIIPFLAFTVSFSTPTRAADVTRAPYLQLTTDTSQTIVWRTDGEVKPEIRIGKSMKKIASAKNEILVKTTADLFQGEKKLQAKKGTIQYEAKLSELEPNTTYYYLYIMMVSASHQRMRLTISKHIQFQGQSLLQGSGS